MNALEQAVVDLLDVAAGLRNLTVAAADEHREAIASESAPEAPPAPEPAPEPAPAPEVPPAPVDAPVASEGFGSESAPEAPSGV